MRALAALGTAAVVAIAAPARAQVALRTEVQARQVEVGERFSFRLTAMSSDGEQPSAPSLTAPPGVTVSGPFVTSQSQMSIVNGQITQRVGIAATWTLVASTPGKLRIGPASVTTSAGRQSGEVVTVEVLPPGTRPAPLGGQPLDPFDLLRNFGRGSGMPGFPFGLDEPNDVDALPAVPEEYQVDRAPDNVAFLRARSKPRRAVVGEQVMLSVYAYGSRGSFKGGGGSEPSHPDFLAFANDDNQPATGYLLDIGGQRWLAARVSEYALFPLRTGTLKAGAMKFRFVGPRYSNDPLGLERRLDPIKIEVTEPPVDGRPVGYKIGDVGRYTLTAEVSPREIATGGSVSVIAKLEGTGNVPYSLNVPEQPGVEWLAPTLVEQVDLKNGVVQGFRTFSYVVEIRKPGQIELGELTLPYWDPAKKSYAIARASLGRVEAKGAAKAPATQGASANGTKLASLIKPKAALGPVPPPPAYFTDRPQFWIALWLMPLVVVVGSGAVTLTDRLRRRLAANRSSLAAATDSALTAVTVAASSGNTSGFATAAERALFNAVELATGIRGRGLLKTELAPRMVEAGVPEATAERTARLLAACDELRFAGGAPDLSELAREVKVTVAELGRVKRRTREAEAAS